MNRIEFMTELAALLQDISAEERIEAMQYYNDYFDDAGEENEEKIIEELESPAKVAAEVKAGLKTQEDDTSEYRETGYTDTRFERKESPAPGKTVRETHGYQDSKACGYGIGREDGKGKQTDEKNPPRTSKVLKIILIIAIVICAFPIAAPLALGIICVILGLGAAVVALFAALLIGSVAVAIAGVVLFVTGLITLVTEFAIGLTLTGSGMIVTVIGVIATVASVRLCIIVFPGIIRGIVWLCRRPFQGRKAVA